MADHVREQIAVAFVNALTGLATTGANVWRERDTDERPLREAELPALLVDDDGEPAEISTLGTARILTRRMRLRVTAHVRALTGAGTSLNQILKEVEIAVAGISSAAFKYSSITDVSAREASEGADRPVMRQSFNFDVLYMTAHNAPDVPL